MFSRSSLTAAFRQLDLIPGDTVMLHASVKAVGPVAGGPDQIHLALLDAISPGGTVMMYAGCSDGFDDIGRGHLSQDEERELIEAMPAFDAGVCRSARDNGILVEFLRTYPGTYTTNHVARMVARGARAEWLVNQAPLNYAYGKGSPMDRLQQIGGKIVLLGSDHDAVTFMHFVEHVTELPDKKIAHFRVPVEVDGERHWLDVEEVNTSGDGAHQNWPERFFAQIVDGFTSSHAVPYGLVGNAATYVLETAALLPYAAARMRQVAMAKTAP